MSKSTTWGNGLLLLVFNNTTFSALGDATGIQASGTAGNIYLSLHTDDPAIGGSQTTNEASYTGYARQAVARSGAGWTVSGRQVINAALIQFGNCTAGGPQEIRFVGYGTAVSGTGKLLYRVPVGVATAPKGFTAVVADTVTVPGHALAVNDKVVCRPTDALTLPTGITEAAVLFVKTVSGNDLTLSATLGGATLDITAAGGGIIAKLVPLTVDTNINPQYAAGQLVLNEG